MEVSADPLDALESCRTDYQNLQLEAAVEHCTTAILSLERGSDEMIEALRVRGLTQFDVGRLDLALADFNSVLEIDPRNTFALNQRANVFNELALMDHAIRDYSAALEVDPFFAEAYINRAIAYLRSGAPDLAQQDAETAFVLKPDDPRITTVRQWLDPDS